MPVGSLVVHQFLCPVQTRNALTLIRLMLLGKTVVQIITPLLSGAYRRTVGLEYWRGDPFVDTRVFSPIAKETCDGLGRARMRAMKMTSRSFLILEPSPVDRKSP